MPATIRLMSWNMENYGTKGFKKFDLGELIATILQTYNIDICAMIEISNNGPNQIANSIVTELNNLGYHQNNWKYTFVNVGDEGVMFLWHEEVPGANAFKGYPYTNNNTKAVAGKVLKDNANVRIYFPKTGSPWSSLPSKADGRRAAYCAFETNDGGAARSFTFLDIHTPFNNATRIQAYTAKVYATAREAVRVETTDAIYAITQAKNAAALHMAAQVDPKIQNALGGPIPTLATTVNEAVYRALSKQLSDGATLANVLEGGANAGVSSVLKMLKRHITASLTTAQGLQLTEAAALAGAMAATYMVASIVLPTAPAAATASVVAATDAARDEAIGSAVYNPPSKKNATDIYKAISRSVSTAVEAAIALFTFPALPTANMDAAILAGDFNIDYPDNNPGTYSQTALNKLGGIGSNAYTGLLNLAHPNLAAINAKTTRIGPTAFESQRIYRLRHPIPIQHTNRNQPNFVDLDVTSLAGVDLLGNDVWTQTLQGLASTQLKVWNTIKTQYGDLIYNAFDSMTVINDTNYYKASKYDNIFVRDATQVSSAVVDVISELGSWVADASGNNYWPAALARANAIAHAKINAENGGMPVSVSYDKGNVIYDLTVAVDDAEQAAVFFDKYVSDHLPVYVEISI
jgi:hypothetical protein